MIECKWYQWTKLYTRMVWSNESDINEPNYIHDGIIKCKWYQWSKLNSGWYDRMQVISMKQTKFRMVWLNVSDINETNYIQDGMIEWKWYEPN